MRCDEPAGSAVRLAWDPLSSGLEAPPKASPGRLEANLASEKGAS